MIHSFNKYLVKMNELGYTNSFEVLNAMDFGIPQKRERVFTVSILGNVAFDFTKLEKQPMKHITEFLEPSINDERYTISIPSMTSKIKEFNDIATNSRYNRFLDVIEDYCWTISTRQDRCPNAGIIKMDNGQYRYLTERECWRLMGFTDEDFEEVLKEYPNRANNRNATLYKLAGNSIVVKVLESIFKVLLNMQLKEAI